MASSLVDFHCHLDLMPDPESEVSAAEEDRIYTLAVTTTPRAWPRNHELTRNTKYVRAALGLHPQLVAKYPNELSIWDNYLSQARYVGEVGLDGGPAYHKSLDQQVEIFEHVLRRCAQVGGKILSVHSVRTQPLVLKKIEQLLPASRGRVVLHWFSGGITHAKRAIELGCYFSVNAEMLQQEKGRKLVATLPSDRLLTETDGPFTHFDNRTARPRDVAQTGRLLSQLRGVPYSSLLHTIENNLRELTS